MILAAICFEHKSCPIEVEEVQLHRTGQTFAFSASGVRTRGVFCRGHLLMCKYVSVLLFIRQQRWCCAFCSVCTWVKLSWNAFSGVGYLIEFFSGGGAGAQEQFCIFLRVPVSSNAEMCWQCPAPFLTSGFTQILYRYLLYRYFVWLVPDGADAHSPPPAIGRRELETLAGHARNLPISIASLIPLYQHVTTYWHI